MSTPRRLLEPDFLQQLERLHLVSKRVLAGRLKGEKRSPRKGASVEFADYRDYVQGDDLRYVDWNIYGRLEKLLIKLFVEEEDLQVYVLLDRSRSMDFGEPNKFDVACRLASALAYLALAGYDRVTLTTFDADLRATLGPYRGRPQLFRLLDYLSQVEADGVTGFQRALRRFALQNRRPGLCCVISDVFDSEGYEGGLTALLARRYEVVLFHLLDASEWDPPWTGDLQLVDVETEATCEVSISRPLLQRYRTAIRRFSEELERFCVRRGILYLRWFTQQPLEELLLQTLRRVRLVR